MQTVLIGTYIGNLNLITSAKGINEFHLIADSFSKLHPSAQ